VVCGFERIVGRLSLEFVELGVGGQFPGKSLGMIRQDLNVSKSNQFTCCQLLVFLYLFEVYSMIGNCLEVLNFTPVLSQTQPINLQLVVGVPHSSVLALRFQ
jgi:hypothetical protein